VRAPAGDRRVPARREPARAAPIDPVLPSLPSRTSALVLLLALSACSGTELYVENDSFAPGPDSDGNYTSGVRLQNNVPVEEVPAWVDRSTRFLNPIRLDEAHVGFFLGQDIFTPEDIRRIKLIEDDRPYAGWLYTGVTRFETAYDPSPRRRDQQLAVELVLGIIGPPSLAEETQKEAHRLTHASLPRGWDNQLDAEPTLMVTARHRYRPVFARAGALEVDAFTLAELELGSPVTAANAGATMRLGLNLPRDFGVGQGQPTRLARERSSGFPGSFYLFAGTVGRAVGHNVFLDGNTFEDSHSVTRDPFVGELLGGAALQLGKLRLSVTLVARTPEFEERQGDHVFGSLQIGWSGQ